MAGADGGENPSNRKKIGVIGSGAVGLYYGARLLEAGHDVSFLCRRDATAIRESGLTIKSLDGDMFVAPDKIQVHTDPQSMGKLDWVLLALKSYSLPAAGELARHTIGPNTRVLAIMNGLGIEEALAEQFPSSSIFGGMAFTCINRGEPGSVNHLKYGSVQIGHLRDDAVQLREAEALFHGSKVKVSTCESYLAARWEKLCWNIPFNGLAVAMGGITTDIIVTDSDLRALALDLMREVVTVANADLKHHGVPERLHLTEEVVKKMFYLTDNMGPYRPSTMIDLCENRPMEVEYLFSRPLGRARALGVPCPSMTSVIRMIRGLQRIRGL